MQLSLEHRNSIAESYDVPPMGNEHHLSQTAYDRLEAELTELRTHGRIELADRIERAREHGDLKENAEYHAAKEEKAKMEARIAKVAQTLEDAVIVDSSNAEGVMVGSVVEIRFEGDDEDETERYLVGSIEERHDELAVVSPTSPMGKALLGAGVGDTVVYDLPDDRGTQAVEVVGVS
jgi:transcription elongation factor GreA